MIIITHPLKKEEINICKYAVIIRTSASTHLEKIVITLPVPMSEI